MCTMASQIPGISIVYYTVCSGADQRKQQRFYFSGFCEGNLPVTGEFPAQMASNVENVSIWWHHHEYLFVWLFNSMEMLSTSEIIGRFPSQRARDADLCHAVFLDVSLN